MMDIQNAMLLYRYILELNNVYTECNAMQYRKMTDINSCLCFISSR